MDEQQEDYSSLPLTDRVTHKIWKVRKQAYEELNKSFEVSASETDPCFRPWLQDAGVWKNIVADSNVAAQQEGVTLLCSFLKFCGPQACLRCRSTALAPLVEKGLTSTKAVTKAKSLEAISLFVELDTPSPVIEELLPFLSHKMPKVIAATANALTTVYRTFGAKTVDPKPVLKQLPKLFGHSDKTVRAEANNLTIELYKWLKDGIKPIFFNDLKPVQQKELDEAFVKVKDEVPKPEKLLRSQQLAATAAAVEDEADEEEAEAPDTFDLFEPVSIFSKAPKDFSEQINSVKWKDRKETLDGLYAAVNVPRIKEEDFSEICRGLAKSMKDANVAVVIIAANCVEAMAKGLRKPFGKYRPTLFIPILDRLKEKKQSVADALGAALDAIFASTSLTDTLEDTLEYLKHKNPQIKLETLRFLIRCLKNTPTPPSKAEVKAITDIVSKLLADTLEATRTAAAEAIGTLMKIIGERAMNPYLDPLDEIRKAKVKEFFDTAEVKAKERPPKPVAAPPQVAAKGPAKKKPAAKSGGPVLKKSQAASATASIADEPLSSPKKALPGKLAGSKPAVGGLKLQRKLPGPSGLASPKKTSMTSEDEQQAAPAAPTSRLGRGGLTGRSLHAPSTATKLADATKPSSISGISNNEREELQELRIEKEKLLLQIQEDRADKSKLQTEISDLQLQNAQLIEEHTRDVLSIKSKETQVLRFKSDLQTAEETIEKKQREIDRLKRELSRFSRSSSPAPTDISDYLYRDSTNGFARDGNASAPGVSADQTTGRVSNTGRSQKRLSYASTASISQEEKENGLSRESRASPPTVSVSGSRDRSGAMSPSSGAGNMRGMEGAEPVESWKRAAEVTSALKMRIEQMKARQNLRGPS